ncbi:XrtV sorting system accessory protein [Bradyrhizobium genosp. P]|uniref:XrtV sorting system accessory protein n=1 Tax=Bradyrhizobium genosp. P TaxID=83641 RepID=UPI003CF95DDD
METLLDVLSVASFAGLVLAFFLCTERDSRTLLHFMISAIVFAIANQVGNGGQTAFAFLLIIAGAVYAAIIIARRPAR